MAEIAFLGTGIMGVQMARRLAQAGHKVRAWNRSRDKAARLAEFGATIADTPAEAARGAEFLVCMLSDGPTCDDVLLNQGAAAALAKDGIVIVMSSIPVDTAQAEAKACAALGKHYIDAPVSGGEAGARDGTLAIMAGGDAAAVARAKPLFEIMGRVTHVGPAGMGSLAKLCNQMIVANTIATVSEALLLAKRGGADPAAVRQAIIGGFADSTILRMHGERILKGDFKPGGPAKHQLKDCRTAIATAERAGLDLPVSALVRQLYEDMVAHGDGEIDHSGLYRELERRNGIG
jgi:3-hydroxyisobutyrate dehydrogenase-like beta-hydroxyacid dehydrogenase